MVRHSCYAATWTDPKPKAFLDCCVPEDREEALEGVSQWVQLWAPTAGQELVGLTCRNPSTQPLGYTKRAEVLEMMVCHSAQFVEWPLGETLQPVMTKSGLEAKSSVAKGVGS